MHQAGPFCTSREIPSLTRANPVRDFGIDKDRLSYVGHDLQRPECILAERDGTLWAADARGGVMRIAPDGQQRIVTQRQSDHFEGADSEAARYLTGTLPNGFAFARNGDFLIANFGTDRLEVMTRTANRAYWRIHTTAGKSAKSISCCAIPKTAFGSPSPRESKTGCTPSART